MNHSRRKFFKQSSLALPLLLTPGVFSCSSFTSTKEVKIDEINLFLINVTKERNFSFGVWKNRQHIMINIKGEITLAGERQKFPAISLILICLLGLRSLKN